MRVGHEDIKAEEVDRFLSDLNRCKDTICATRSDDPDAQTYQVQSDIAFALRELSMAQHRADVFQEMTAAIVRFKREGTFDALEDARRALASAQMVTFLGDFEWGNNRLSVLKGVEDQLLECLRIFPDQELPSGKTSREYTEHWTKQILFSRTSRELRMAGDSEALRTHLKGALEGTSVQQPHIPHRYSIRSLFSQLFGRR